MIVSAGAMGSPHLLMWSGIGPAAQLNAFNISVVVDNPNVGQGMRDNPMNALGIPLTQSIEYSAIEVVGIPQTFGAFIETASMNAANLVSLQVPTALISPCNASAISLNFDTVTNFAALLQKVAGPVSSGELKLNGSDFTSPPSVRFNYYSNPEDLRSCVAGAYCAHDPSTTHHIAACSLSNGQVQGPPRFLTKLLLLLLLLLLLGLLTKLLLFLLLLLLLLLLAGTRTMLDVLYSRALAPLVTDAICLPAVLEILYSLTPSGRDDDAEIASFCERTVRTIWHYHGGCVVGKVVDADYRVLGTQALRVIDGSTFVNSPGTNPQATVMMLGR